MNFDEGIVFFVPIITAYLKKTAIARKLCDEAIRNEKEGLIKHNEALLLFLFRIASEF
jgi:hypothetical protein